MRSHLRAWGVGLSAILFAAPTMVFADPSTDSVLPDGRPVKVGAFPNEMDKADITQLKKDSTIKFSSSAFREASNNGPTQWQTSPTDHALQKTVLGSIFTVDPVIEDFCNAQNEVADSYGNTTNRITLDYNVGNNSLTLNYTSAPKDGQAGAKTTHTLTPPTEVTLYQTVRTYPWDSTFQNARSAKVALYRKCESWIKDTDKYDWSNKTDDSKKYEGQRLLVELLEKAIKKNETSAYCDVFINRVDQKFTTNMQPDTAVTITGPAVKQKDSSFYEIPLTGDKRINSISCGTGVKGSGPVSISDLRYLLRMGNASRLQFDPKKETEADQGAEGGSVDWNSPNVVDPKVNAKRAKPVEPTNTGGNPGRNLQPAKQTKGDIWD